MNQLISVIIPIYNVENYLSRCLDSVINQTYKNLEIILVNDGTPDNSVAVAEQYLQKDNRIRLYHQENAGLSEARNTGIHYASGDYIAFLDSDDWLELDAYDYLVNFIEKTDADMVCGASCRTSQVVENKSLSEVTEEVLTQKEYARKYFKIGSQTIEYYVWNRLYKRHVIEGTKQPKGLYAEDVPSTFMYILKCKTIAISNKIVHNYFVNNDGLSARFSKRHLEVLDGWDMVVAMAEQSQDSDYMKWARFNRKRANFALLTELALASNFKELSKELHPQMLPLVRDLQRDFWVLLTGPMPISRKLLLPLFSSQYFFFAALINKCLRRGK